MTHGTSLRSNGNTTNRVSKLAFEDTMHTPLPGDAPLGELVTTVAPHTRLHKCRAHAHPRSERGPTQGGNRLARVRSLAITHALYCAQCLVLETRGSCWALGSAKSSLDFVQLEDIFSSPFFLIDAGQQPTSTDSMVSYPVRFPPEHPHIR